VLGAGGDDYVNGGDGNDLVLREFGLANSSTSRQGTICS
jgi:hypothetical protein